jgi:hypothetical protein
VRRSLGDLSLQLAQCILLAPSSRTVARVFLQLLLSPSINMGEHKDVKGRDRPR